jgi:cobalt-zinc-cadmium efflux system membrane fusion protein
MFIEAQIVTGSARVMALPEAAVVHLEGGDFVCQLRLHEKGNYLLSRVKVITGDTAGGYTVIENSSDFEEGAQFLTKGAYAVLTNQ